MSSERNLTAKAKSKLSDTIRIIEKCLGDDKLIFTNMINITISQKLGEWCSKGVGAFGPLFLALIIIELWEEFHLPIISVGSGRGVTESLINTINSDVRVICIDPLSFKTQHSESPKLECDESVFFVPHYSSVEEAILTEDLIGKCVVVSIWSLPNEYSYDLDAVETLQPVAVMTVDEPSGSAGSNAMLNYDFEESGYIFSNVWYSLYPDILSSGYEQYLRCRILSKKKIEISKELTLHFTEDEYGNEISLPVYVDERVLTLFRLILSNTTSDKARTIEKIIRKYDSL